MSDSSPSLNVFGPALRFGRGVVEHAGDEAVALGWHRVLLVTDTDVLATAIPGRVASALARRDVWCETLTAPPAEPRNDVLDALLEPASNGVFDGIFAVGGGAVLDTAKLIALLLAPDAGALLDYVNPPFGAGDPPSLRMPGVVAVPTTAGSGSDVSGVAVVDLVGPGVKTAVSHARLRPRVALADPEATLTVPATATAAAGLDVLAHALESLTARSSPPEGAVYVGRNPYSNALCGEALPLLLRALPVAVRDGNDLEARTDVMLAATLANLGAAVAGSHVGHAIAYAVAAADRDGTRRVPHGFAAALAAPGLLRELQRFDRRRHDRIAAWLGGPPEPVVEQLLTGCRAKGLHEYGFERDEVDTLVDHALTQERLVANAPPQLDREALARIVRQMIEQP